MKKVLTVVLLAALPMSVNAIGPAPVVESDIRVVAEQEELATEDVVMGAGIGASLIASLASAAAPAVVAHSSGMAIMWSGTGYVAGTIGLGAATVAALPIIATAGAVTAGGAYAYKHRDVIADYSNDVWNYYFGDDQ